MSCEVSLFLDVANEGADWKAKTWIFSSSSPSDMFSVLQSHTDVVYKHTDEPKVLVPWESLLVVHSEYPILDTYYMDPAQGQLNSYAYIRFYSMRQRLLLLLICDQDSQIIEPYPFVYVGQAEIRTITGSPVFRIDATRFDDEIQIDIEAAGYKDHTEWYTFTTQYEWKTLMIRLEKV
jgi:hypothetical protein